MRKASSRFDAVIVGAGVSGIYMLYRIRELGIRATLLESGHGVGGTWYWNRYPGARFDSESYSYGYSFSKELLDEWNWSEHFAGQAETLRYLNRVVDKFELRTHMQFGCTVTAAHFDDVSSLWCVTLGDGRTLETKFLLTAVGMLSAPTYPAIQGRETFQGASFHTHDWPRETVDLNGRRVAVVGTGATAVQLIPEVAKEAAQLTVFQRHPNWCAPLNNGSIDELTMKEIKASYDEIFERCSRTPGGFIHGPDRREFDEVAAEVREQFWERLYNARGFGVWLGNFVECLTEARANAVYSAFIANKIRERVSDPVIAEKLIPSDHGFGARRVPLESGYYEAFNRSNVELVDLNETPIERITRDGIQTSEETREFDLIVYATGFDAITGAYDRIDIRGTSGQRLRDKWRRRPATYLGLQTAGFPNLTMIVGPQSGSVSTNIPRGVEDSVNWTMQLLKFMLERGYERVDALPAAEREWTNHVKDTYDHLLVATTKSWFTGYNSNIAHGDKVRYLVYFGGAPKYRERLAQVANAEFDGFEFR